MNKLKFKVIFIIAIVFIPFLFLDSSINFFSDKNCVKSDTARHIKLNDKNYLTLVFVGDLMCHTPQIEYAKIDSGGYDFFVPFNYIKDEIQSADFAIGNLETVLGGKKLGYSGYPFFNSPDEYAAALKKAGFDIIITANNHSYDKGEEALKRTARILDSLGLSYIGTFVSLADFDSIRIFEKNGISFTISAFTYGLNYINSLPEDKKHLVNFISKKNIEKRFIQAKQKRTDINIIYLHFGNEYQREPSKYQKEIVQFCADLGFNIIVACHPHVLQPVELLKSDSSKTKYSFVAYSLGNFISNQRHRYTDGGGILKIKIAKSLTRDSVSFDKVEFYPTWVFKGRKDNKKQYVILYSDSIEHKEIYYFLTDDDWKAYKQSFGDALEILTKYYKSFSVVSKVKLNYNFLIEDKNKTTNNESE